MLVGGSKTRLGAIPPLGSFQKNAMTRPIFPGSLTGSELRVPVSRLDASALGPKRVQAGAASLNGTEIRRKH
jgi:hypothetical protein